MICNFPLKSPDVVLLQGSLLALSPAVQIRLAAAATSGLIVAATLERVLVATNNKS